MSSLQDQLLKAGLVDKKQAKKVDKDKRKQKKVEKRTKNPTPDPSKAHIAQARAEKIARDKALNKERESDTQKKAIIAQIKQLISHHKQASGADDNAIEYNFRDAKHIKKMRVSPTVHQQIINGLLAIALHDEGYALVPRVIADKIIERDASFVIIANTQNDAPEEDDPYKDYQIPDDLMW